MDNRRLLGLVVGLALIVAGCGDGGAEVTTTSADGAGTAVAAADDDVVMENLSFQPAELTVSAGSTVMWTNNDGVSHTTSSEEDLWDSGTLVTGESFSFAFDEPGTYSYICTIHPGQMQATVTVEG